jgi:hypothetical protein
MNIATIAVLRSSQKSIFWSPPGFKEVSEAAMATFKHPLSDDLTVVNAYNAYLHVRKIMAEKTKDNDVSHGGLINWRAEQVLNAGVLEDVLASQVRLDEWLQEIAKLEMKMASITDSTIVVKALATAFSTHPAINSSEDQYRTVHENSPALLLSNSSWLQQQYEWVT